MPAGSYIVVTDSETGQTWSHPIGGTGAWQDYGTPAK
jgi:hypothetical protein